MTQRTLPADMPVQANNIPPELKVLKNWVLWSWEFREGRNGGNWTKVPRRPSGRAAETNNPASWSSFDDAFTAYQFGECPTTKLPWSGIGLVLPDGMVGIDLDDVRTDGKFNQTAEVILAKFPTYAEISPSGTGVKLIAGGYLSSGSELKTKSAERGVELYAGGLSPRYFTITGNVLPDRPSHRTVTGQRDSLHWIQTLISDPIPDVPDPGEAPDPDAVGTARAALAALKDCRAANYWDWTTVGMALKSVDPGVEMWQVWDEWSQSDPKYNGPEETRAKWDSFRRETGRIASLATLKRMAVEDGWKPNRYQTKAIVASKLCATKIEREYIVDDFLVAREPAIIGGASKSLKTSVALDLAVSIATASPFLGTRNIERITDPGGWNGFPVRTARKVLMISGESGESTIQDSLKQIAIHKGLQFTDLHNLLIGFHLAKLDDSGQVADLIEELKGQGVEVVIIDPLYRSLRVGDAASNVYSMGEKLDLIAEQIHRAGLTPILLHHFRKQGRTHTEPPELEDLSQSGIAEFARQFLLLKRREVYQRDGNHVLWFSWGGSAGHQGSGVLRVRTGTAKGGLSWDPELLTEEKYKAESKQKQETEKAKNGDDRESKILALLGQKPGLTRDEILNEVGGKTRTVSDCLGKLVKMGEVEIEARSEGFGRPKKLYFLPTEAT